MGALELVAMDMKARLVFVELLNYQVLPNMCTTAHQLI